MASNGSTDGDTAESNRVKPPPGVVIPPKEFHELLERTASFVARRGQEFEERLVDQAKTNSKLQFALKDNPYRPYYDWRISEIRAGRGLDGADGATPAPGAKKKRGPPEPAEFEFSARVPTISAVDLEVIKLTALFAAKHGRAWMTGLSQREAQNNQFNFLRPQHSLYNFFSRLVDQYSALLNGANIEDGAPQKKRIAELEHNVKDKYHTLERARLRAEWKKYQEAQKVRKEELEQAEKLAFAQIDWHDFVVVGTIDFTEADEQVDLPAPTTLNDIQSASLEQKAAFAAPVDRQLEEAMPEDFAYLANQTANVPTPQPPPPTTQMSPPQMPYQPSPQPTMSPNQFAPPPQASDPEEQARIAERQAEQARAQQAQAAAKGQGPMRIRNDYVPRAMQNRRTNVQTVLCPICSQQIPSDEYEKHVKIEQMDPRWREQTRIAQQRSATTNLSTIDVANNLKRLASKRSDVFDPVTGQAVSEEELSRRKRVEMSSYDGQSQPAPQANKSMNVQDQIRQLQSKYGQS